MNHPAPPSISVRRSSVSAIRLGAFARLILAAACCTLVSMMAAPSAKAAAPNGVYTFSGGSGSLVFAGQTILVDDDMIKEIITLKDGTVTISKNRLPLNRPGTAALINQIGKQLGVGFKTSLTGPTFVQLAKSGSNFVGNTANPLVLKFKGTVEGQTLSGNLKANFRAKVREETLVVTVPITGNALGFPITGQLRIVCKRR